MTTIVRSSSDSSIEFGNVTPGTHYKWFVVTVANTGTAAVQVCVVSYPANCGYQAVENPMGSGNVSGSSCASIPPKSTVTVKFCVSWTPTSAGEQPNGSVQVSVPGDPAGPLVLAAHGLCGYAHAAVAMSAVHQVLFDGAGMLINALQPTVMSAIAKAVASHEQRLKGVKPVDTSREEDPSVIGQLTDAHAHHAELQQKKNGGSSTVGGS